MATPVTLIFDVGKTNKKVLLFDEQFKVVFEETIQLQETVDEDGFACEDVDLLTAWIQKKIKEISVRKDVAVKAINFSAYGASFVNLDANLNACTPLYNYLKPYPEKLKQQFYKTYGNENLIAKETASPVLGSLNSGMQLYRLKYEKPEVYNKIKWSLHLPQHLSFIITKKIATDISSVGCHTNLWYFKKNDYHGWVYKEALNKKFAPLFNGDKILATINNIKVGIGLHDSSAALVPYFRFCNEPFILISTGTWNITLNPFNHSPLAVDELKKDCLCYLSYKGKPVKASRLFAGFEHENAVKKIASHFNQQTNFYHQIKHNSSTIQFIQSKFSNQSFNENKLEQFSSAEEAYYTLMIDIVRKQFRSTSLILDKNFIQKIFVDGGFSKNEIFMQLLADAFPNIQVYAASVAQASALGAALVLPVHENISSANFLKVKLYQHLQGS